MHCVVRLLLGMLLLSGAASARADLVPSPGQVDFGWQAIGTTSEPKATTLRNTGSEALTIVAVQAASGVYARTGGTCGAAPFAIAAQSSCTLEHTFTPTGTAWFPQTLAVTLDGGTSVNFGLFGQSEPGYLDVSPTSLTFLSQPVGSISSERTAVFSNTSHVSLVVTQMTTTSVPPGSFVLTRNTCPEPPFEVSAPGGCMVGYTFAPQQTGSASGDLYIVASSGTFILFLGGDGAPEIPLFDDGFEQPAAASIE